MLDSILPLIANHGRPLRRDNILSAQTRYAELAQKLKLDLEAGLYPRDTRLPSIRHLCAAFGASPITVTHALHLLEDQGLIEARGRAGFFACTAKAAPLLPTQTTPLEPQPHYVALSERRAETLAFRGQIGANQHDRLSNLRLDPSLYPASALIRGMQELARKNPQFITDWSGPPSPRLQTQLARRYARFGCHWQVEEIFITDNHMDSVHSMLELLTRPGDLVAVQSPCPMVLLDILDHRGVNVLEIPTDPAEGLSLDTLAFALKHHTLAACVFEANFPNPTGSLMSDEAKRKTVALLAEHKVPLIEDDKFGDIYFGVNRPLPFKAFDANGIVYYCGELGFLLAPGLSAGFAAVGDQRLAFHYARASRGNYGPTRLVRHLLADFMADGRFERHLRRLRQHVAQNMVMIRNAVLAHFPAQTRVAAPKGGALLWLELPRMVDTSALLDEALKLGVGFVPGRFFSLDDSFKHCLRLNAGFRPDAALTQEIATLGRLVHAHCS